MSGERPKAIATGTLMHIGINADCYVLSNGIRVLSQRGIVRAITAKNPDGSGGRESGNLDPYIKGLPNDSRLFEAGVVEFNLTTHGVALGRSAEWFIDLLKSYKSAWRDGDLHSSRVALAKTADSMLDACAAVGLVALIDEATGYEHIRKHGDLARLFDRLLLMQAAKWSRMWPADTIASLCKTYRIEYEGHGAPAPLMGVIGWIYKTILGSDVHGEVKRRNPRRPDREKHHQYFQPQLRELMAGDLVIVKAFSDQSRGREEFRARLLSHYRKEPFQLGLPSTDAAEAAS